MDYETDASLGPNFVHDKPADQAARDREISELQQGFKNGTVTIRQFLERASYKNEPDVIYINFNSFSSHYLIIFCPFS